MLTRTFAGLLPRPDNILFFQSITPDVSRLFTGTFIANQFLQRLFCMDPSRANRPMSRSIVKSADIGEIRILWAE
jgi:hypothetical protein